MTEPDLYNEICQIIKQQIDNYMADKEPKQNDLLKCEWMICYDDLKNVFPSIDEKLIKEFKYRGCVIEKYGDGLVVRYIGKDTTLKQKHSFAECQYFYTSNHLGNEIFLYKSIAQMIESLIKEKLSAGVDINKSIFSGPWKFPTKVIQNYFLRYFEYDGVMLEECKDPMDGIIFRYVGTRDDIISNLYERIIKLENKIDHLFSNLTKDELDEINKYYRGFKE